MLTLSARQAAKDAEDPNRHGDVEAHSLIDGSLDLCSFAS